LLSTPITTTQAREARKTQNPTQHKGQNLKNTKQHPNPIKTGKAPK